MQTASVPGTACRLIKVFILSSFAPSWGVYLRAAGLHVSAVESSRLNAARGQITLGGAEVSSPAHAEPGSHFIFIHHHTALLLHWKMRRSWGGHEGQRTAQLQLLEPNLFLLLWFSLTKIYWPSSIISTQPPAWMWPLEEKRVLLRLFCTEAEILLKFWSLMFHLCRSLILSSWERNGSERLRSFPDFHRHGR